MECYLLKVPRKVLTSSLCVGREKFLWFFCKILLVLWLASNLKPMVLLNMVPNLLALLLMLACQRLQQLLEHLMEQAITACVVALTAPTSYSWPPKPKFQSWVVAKHLKFFLSSSIETKETPKKLRLLRTTFKRIMRNKDRLITQLADCGMTVLLSHQILGESLVFHLESL